MDVPSVSAVPSVEEEQQDFNPLFSGIQPLSEPQGSAELGDQPVAVDDAAPPSEPRGSAEPGNQPAAFDDAGELVSTAVGQNVAHDDV